MFAFFGTLFVIFMSIFFCGYGIWATDDYEWRCKWHKVITFGSLIAMVISSTILNIISESMV